MLGEARLTQARVQIQFDTDEHDTVIEPTFREVCNVQT